MSLFYCLLCIKVYLYCVGHSSGIAWVLFQGGLPPWSLCWFIPPSLLLLPRRCSSLAILLLSTYTLYITFLEFKPNRGEVPLGIRLFLLRGRVSAFFSQYYQRRNTLVSDLYLFVAVSTFHVIHFLYCKQHHNNV